MTRSEVRDLAVSLCVAAAYAVSVVLRRHGHYLVYDLYYNLPIVAPFVLFGLNRFIRRAEVGGRRLALDAAVVLLAASRVIVPLPGISGHTLFLTHAVLTTQRVPRVAAALVLAEVTVIKLGLWHDATWFGGLALGVVASVAWRRWLQPAVTVRPVKTDGQAEKLRSNRS